MEMKGNLITAVVPGRGNRGDFKLRGAVMIGILDFVGAFGTDNVIIGSLSAKRIRHALLVNAHRAVLASCLLVYVGVWGFAECEAKAQEEPAYGNMAVPAEIESKAEPQQKTDNETSGEQPLGGGVPVIYKPFSHLVVIPLILGLLIGFCISKLIIILNRES